MDFKSNFRKQYEQQVKPAVPPDAWAKFEAHRKEKKKKNRLFIWFLIPVGLLFLLSTLWLFSPQNDKNRIQEQPVEVKIVTAAEKEPGLIEGNIITKLPDKNSQNAEPVEDSKDAATFKNVKDDYATMHSLNNPKLIRENTFQTTSNNKSQRSTLSAVKKPEKLDKNNEHLSRATIAEQRTRYLIPLKAITPGIQHQRIPSIHIINTSNLGKTNNENQISAQKAHHLALKSRNTTMGKFVLFNIGAGFARNTHTLEESAFNLGVEYVIPLGKRLHLSTELGFHSIDYQAKVMQQELGLRTVGAPSPGQTFSKAEVESHSIQFGLGVKYQLFSKNNWSLHSGLNYLLAKELIKDADYFFEGQEADEEFDDEILTFHNHDTYFIYNMIKPEITFSWIPDKTGIHFSISRPWQLNSNKIDLLNQWQFKLGIRQGLN